MINTKTSIVFLIGLGILIFGLAAKVNLGVLALYAIPAIIFGIAEYRHWGFLPVVPVFVFNQWLLISGDIAEVAYSVGSIFLVWSFVLFLRSKA